jgi:hypothetical protein
MKIKSVYRHTLLTLNCAPLDESRHTKRSIEWDVWEGKFGKRSSWQAVMRKTVMRHGAVRPLSVPPRSEAEKSESLRESSEARALMLLSSQMTEP